MPSTPKSDVTDSSDNDSVSKAFSANSTGYEEIVGQLGKMKPYLSEGFAKPLDLRAMKGIMTRLSMSNGTTWHPDDIKLVNAGYLKASDTLIQFRDENATRVFDYDSTVDGELVKGKAQVTVIPRTLDKTEEEDESAGSGVATPRAHDENEFGTSVKDDKSEGNEESQASGAQPSTSASTSVRFRGVP